MKPLADEWSIQHRAESCAVTGEPFVAGENFYTLLFRDGDGFRRQDLSETAWRQRNENLQPFSFWRSRFEPPPAIPPEPLPKENAEELFRRLVAEADRRERQCLLRARGHARAKKDPQTNPNRGVATRGRVLIYEHQKTGDVFVVPDPQLRLDELEGVQMEVMGLMTNAE